MVGHEIGLHGSYNPFRGDRQMAREKEGLSAACTKAGLDLVPEGNRQALSALERRDALLRQRQHPLVLVKCSVLSSNYVGMVYSDEAFDLMQLLKRRALYHGGDFTLLWHSSEFFTPKDREFFDILLK